MNNLTDFSFIEKMIGDAHQVVSVAMVCPNDSHTEWVIDRALQQGWARFILTTAAPLTPHLANTIEQYKDRIEIVQCADGDQAAATAVSMVREGRAQVLMKGTINTDNLLRAVLNKQHGLLEEGAVMCHIAVAHIPAYHKLLVFSDAAVVPQPQLQQFDAIVSHCVSACRRMGVVRPKVALTHCTEKTSEKFPCTICYGQIKEWASQGRYGDVDIQGPMDVKTAIDAESAAIKGLQGSVAGDADIMIMPDIEAGNTFYKTITLLANAQVAGWLAGTTAPVVVASRADSEESKYFSLAMAAMTSIR